MLFRSEIRGDLDEMVRSTIEETLNAMLDIEADEAEVKIPKLRKQTFETAINERYRPRNISIKHAIDQMYLSGVSVRGVADITTTL